MTKKDKTKAITTEEVGVCDSLGGAYMVDRKIEDWVAGSESGIRGERNIYNFTSKSFTIPSEHLPSDENQIKPIQGGLMDNFSCVSFSTANIIEMHINRINMIVKEYDNSDTISETASKYAHAVKFLEDNGYLDSNRKVNFSDRFVAVASGTSKNGNAPGIVWDSVRKYGLIPESMCPAPDTSNMDYDVAWDKYHNRAEVLTKDNIAMGQKFLQYFKLSYEWVPISRNADGVWTTSQYAVLEYLRRGPIQVCARTCSGWFRDKVIQGCGYGANHAFTVIGINWGKSYVVFDSVNECVKELSWDYVLPYGLQGFVDVIPEVKEDEYPADLENYTFNTYLEYNNPKNKVWALHNLQLALQYLGYMKKDVFGPFGPQTRLALYAFQKDNKIVGDEGLHFGPRTIKAMNKALASKKNIVSRAVENVSDKMEDVMTSSTDPNKISLTFKSIMLAIAPVIYLITGISEENYNTLVGSATTIVASAVTIFSAIMFIYGMIRKIKSKQWNAIDTREDIY